MTVCTWTGAELRSTTPELLLDELDDVAVLVLDEVVADGSVSLDWCRRAPCVVVAMSTAGPPPPEVDIALVGEQRERLDALLDSAEANPMAAHTLADVLRVVPGLDVAGGLVVESLAYSMLLAGDEFQRWLARQPPRASKPFDGAPVRVARDGSSLRVTLARPENRNAFSAELRDALHAALVATAADDAVTAVHIDAEGPVFSSGGDLTEFGTTPDVVRAHEIRTLRGVGAAIHRLGERTTVHVKGNCVGAGVELSAFAGRVVADPGTTFRLPEVGMGLVPGAGGTVSVTRRIGAQRTAELALSGRAMAAAEAREIGLVDAIA